MKAAITGAINNVAHAMTNAGVLSAQYSIAVNYPSPMPSSSGFRYSQSGYTRQSTGGCGFWNRDANYANSTMLPTIDSTVVSAAAATGLSNVKTMELSGAFNGRRLCEGVGLLEEEGLSNWKASEAPNKSEWFSQVRTLTALFGPTSSRKTCTPNDPGAAGAP